jgi:hypothetical protein
MITLVIWSFALALVPLTVGVAWNVSAAVARTVAASLKVEGGRLD